MSNGEEFFNASKPDRNAAFSFPNERDFDAEARGDQHAGWHPVPANLGVGQKVGQPVAEATAPVVDTADTN